MSLLNKRLWKIWITKWMNLQERMVLKIADSCSTYHQSCSTLVDTSCRLFLSWRAVDILLLVYKADVDLVGQCYTSVDISLLNYYSCDIVWLYWSVDYLVVSRGYLPMVWLLSLLHQIINHPRSCSISHTPTIWPLQRCSFLEKW